MNAEDVLNPLYNALEALHGRFVIKDFVGFLNWEPNLGAALLTYCGHHEPFCTTVKQNAEAYAQCVKCSTWHQRRCRRGAPFSKACFLGLQEYSVPIMLEQVCIGSISVGLYCPDPLTSARRIESMSRRFDMDKAVLMEQFSAQLETAEPSEGTKAVFRFMAGMLSEMFCPYVGRANLLQEKAVDKDAGFKTIQNYICNNYTDPNISVASIAKNCNYSQSYVSHIFSQRMKINLRTYINQLRIVLAKHELSRGGSVTATSTVCGFNDTNYFSTVFRTMVGIPPSQWASHEQLKLREAPPPLPETRADFGDDE